MNEQLIGDLFAEATRRMTGSSSREFSEKVAELIVRECAGLFPNVYVEIENEYGHTPVIAADYIKKHFGVEE
jgi:hypothetical protein